MSMWVSKVVKLVCSASKPLLSHLYKERLAILLLLIAVALWMSPSKISLQDCQRLNGNSYLFVGSYSVTTDLECFGKLHQAERVRIEFEHSVQEKSLAKRYAHEERLKKLEISGDILKVGLPHMFQDHKKDEFVLRLVLFLADGDKEKADELLRQWHYGKRPTP